MRTGRQFGKSGSIASLAAVALSALVIGGCTSSKDDAAPSQEAGPGADASESIVDAGRGEASVEAGRTVQLTWQVAAAPLLLTEGLDAGDAGHGGGLDAGDGPSDAGLDANSAGGPDASNESQAGSDALAPGGPSDAAGDGGYTALAGVSVCVYQNSAIPCVMTDAHGVFILAGLPAGSEIAITFRRDGYLPVIAAVATPNTDLNVLNSGGPPVQMPSSTVSSVTPVPIDSANKGTVDVVAVIPGSTGKATDSTGDVGAKFNLRPMTGNGPYYLNKDNSAIVPSATSTVYEAAVYLNLAPGSYEVAIDDPTHTCSPLSPLVGVYGYPAPPTSVRFPILAGYVTSAVAFYCTAKSIIVNATDAN